MTPELATPGATSAARPFCATVIVPALTIAAFGLGDGRSNRILPAMKLAFEMSVGVAMMLLTLTCDPLLKTTPFGLISTRDPLAVSCPAIVEGLAALTRLSVIAAVEGCTKLVRSPTAMSKLDQSMVA